MDDDVLSKVVEVEREIQQRLEVEKKMSQEWLENVKRNAEERLLTEEKGLRVEINEAIRKAKLEAEKKAAAIISDANEEAKRLKGLGDEMLKKTLLKHIFKVLSGS